jgi:nucleoside phosphorylase
MLEPEDYTVGIICPLEVELSAVRYMLDGEHSSSTAPQYARYIFGELSKHNVVVATLPINAQGKFRTAIIASELRKKFQNVSHYLLVGIGGGVPTQAADVRLGDVVVSVPSGTHAGVVQYDLGNKYVDGFKRMGFLAAPAREFLQILPKMISDHRVKKSKIDDFLSAMQTRMQAAKDNIDHRQFLRPPQSLDRLFKPDYEHPPDSQTCRDDDKEKLVERDRRKHPHRPVIHYGLIASGDSVIKDAVIRDRISEEAGGAICFDMEAAGMMNDFQPLAIRGICDYADSHKNDDWHGYAAAVAAGMAKEILTYIPPGIYTPQFVYKFAVNGTTNQTKKHHLSPWSRPSPWVGRWCSLARSAYKKERFTTLAMSLARM